jgi:hypothetical protein
LLAFYLRVVFLLSAVCTEQCRSHLDDLSRQAVDSHEETSRLLLRLAQLALLAEATQRLARGGSDDAAARKVAVLRNEAAAAVRAQGCCHVWMWNR